MPGTVLDIKDKESNEAKYPSTYGVSILVTGDKETHQSVVCLTGRFSMKKNGVRMGGWFSVVVGWLFYRELLRKDSLIKAEFQQTLE